MPILLRRRFGISNTVNQFSTVYFKFFLKNNMQTLQRFENRAFDALRPLNITPNFTQNAEASVLFELGKTKVLCTATLERNLPTWLLNKNQGWLSAEYAMLPRATPKRTKREAVKGKQTGRTQEIQRLIGRSLRACLDFSKMPGFQFLMDCDVLQADGSTRCACICGAFVALKWALLNALKNKVLEENPLIDNVSAVSVGIVGNNALLDLDYKEDSSCDTDMNVVMLGKNIVEIQGTAEGAPFNRAWLNRLLDLSEKGNLEIQNQQNAIFK